MLLFLDVDGTLIPFGGTAPYPQYGRPSPPSPHPLLPRLDPALGPRLLALGCESVWATTWLDDANTVLGPWLGLPALPVVRWPDETAGAAAEGDPAAGGVHWKTRPLVEWASGRPFVWLDDEITSADRSWVAAHHPGRALLHRVDQRRGLTDEDFAVVADWIAGVRSGGG
ncbi:HAD domain-containing protein [Streptomyces sp. NPDC050263]|uniref:HAD domain-containing protein n=1 Tax=Streptomyces sp. NPDC050263 TaxID=3155037 RepID=UPI00343823E3